MLKGFALLGMPPASTGLLISRLIAREPASVCLVVNTPPPKDDLELNRLILDGVHRRQINSIDYSVFSNAAIKRNRKRKW